MRTSKAVRVTATGDVTTSTSYLRAVVLTAGSDAATLAIRAGGGSGTLLQTVKAAASTSVPVPLYDALFAAGVHATLTGTGPEATFYVG